MKAAYFEEHGGPEVIKIGELPDPVAGAGEIVIYIHAASVNGADWKVREGSYKQVPYFPYVLGRDFSALSANWVRAFRILRLAIRCLASVMLGRKALIAKKLR